MEPQQNSSYADAFLPDQSDLGTPFNAPRHTPLFSRTRPSFTSPSRSPSTPAHLAFNPDDFLVSPPPVPSTSRATPDLKRRLFAITDPLLSAPNTSTKPSVSSTPALATPLSFPVVLPPDPASPHESPPPSPPPLPSVKALPSVKPLQSAHPPKAPPPKTKCNCKASRCLKLYCPCFAASSFCAPSCTCKNCQNISSAPQAVREARETVLARDPRAFDPKVRNAAAAAVGADIHSKGCNCRKGCGKNYCVCRELRVVCGPRCTCSGPVGCLNGKTEGGDDALATPAKLPITKPGAPAPWFRAALLPNRGVGRPTAEAGLAVSQERKKQKREDVNATTGTPLRNFSQLLSPSFPLLNIDMSPSVGLPDNMDDFQQVMNVNQGIFTPFCMRKIDGSPMSKTVGKMVMGCSKPLHSEVVDTQSTMVQTDPVRRRIALDGLDEDIEMSQAGRNEANDSKTGKRVRLSGGVGCKGNSFKTKEECIADGQDGSHTPEQVAKLSDIDFAMSPTTGNRDCGTWGSMRHTLFERQDKIEVCRLPRILRVKMGSGRPLRKFDI